MKKFVCLSKNIKPFKLILVVLEIPCPSVVLSKLQSILFVLSCFLLSAQSLAAQNNTARSYIQALQKKDALSQLQNQHTSAIGQLDGRLPRIEQIEFRTETDRFELAKQEYTSRISTNGRAERKMQNTLNLFEQNNLSVEQQAWSFRITTKAYKELVDWAGHQSVLTWFDAKKLVLEDKRTILSKIIQHAGSKEFDEWFKVESDLEALEMQQLEQELSIQLYQKNTENSQAALETSTWLSSEAMLLKMQIENSILANHSDLIPFQNKQLRNELRAKLERAKSKRILDYVQVRYTDREKEMLRGDLSFGMGIALPYRGSSKVDLYELKINTLEIQREQAEMQQVLEQKMVEIKGEAQILSKILAKSKESLQSAQADKNIDKLASTQETHPLLLLNLRLLDLQRQKRILDLDQEIRQLYVEWLEISGRIGQETGSSWLEE